MILDNFVPSVSSFMSLLPIINDIQPDLPNTMTCCISAKSLLRCCSDGCQSLGWLEAFHNSKTACLTDWSQFFVAHLILFSVSSIPI